ncbi:ATP-dependent helicase dcl1 [Myriangium duriaei CBS 260.36]|uniref:Dicer-like protein 1 n=1 Tax=Myriangium duriaei CBS 260.36 TaxID=1168546 RepID=A0A9P4J1V1_9PEZI|nr:ATP-dependent helicase dcl1 [Myriangium duriaei CBS 260.36]
MNDTVVVSDSEDDDYDDNGTALPAQKPIHKTIFQAWMVTQVKADIAKKPTYAAEKFSQPEVLSLGQIMGQQQPDRIVHDPREYQLELFDRAREQNTIAVLDTGTGKTLIAVLLLRHIIDQELEDRQRQKHHRIAFFLVPSVNLVFQQHAVLVTNLDQPVARVHGGLRPDLWTADQWEKIFESNKAVVCTPDILKMCLDHGFLNMRQINLLIFDEAHHTKLSHAYSKILNEHYALLQESQRPRIFGMTASPVDIKAADGDVKNAATELEINLHSKIATTTHLAPLQSVVHRPTERVVSYFPFLQPLDSVLRQEIRSRFSHLPFVPGMILRAQQISKHLGPWCGDLYWKHVFKEQIESKSDSILNRFMGKHRSGIDSTRYDQDLEDLRKLLYLVSNAELQQPTRQGVHASPKVVALHDSLREYFSLTNDCRCIIFVEERMTAYLLASYFRALKDLCMECDVLVGGGTADSGIKLSIRQQVMTLLRFKKGDLNCIFATSVAEEGLDIASCNIIIRFDPCKTMIQYVQSRGRARRRNSHLLHMVEEGNQDHIMLLDNNQRAEGLMRAFCARIPDDRKVADFSYDTALPPEAGSESYRSRTTDAVLTLSNSTRILADFATTLPHREEEFMQPIYVTESAPGGFISQVMLPNYSPIPGSRGKVKRRKAWSRFSAAFQTCKELIRYNHLDEHFVSKYKDRRSTVRQLALAANLRTSNQYKMRSKPRWSLSEHTVDSLYGTLITFERLDRPFRPLLLLSRRKPLQYPGFPVFPTSEVAANVRLDSHNQLISVSDDELQRLTQFTLRVFKDLFNKTYEFEPSKMPYWIAPAASNAEQIGPVPSVDWSIMSVSCEEEPVRWSPEIEPMFLVDKFFIDPYNGGKRYFSNGVATNLTPDDPNPLWDGKGKTASILETTISLWRKSRAGYKANHQQPVLKADRVLHRRNLLAPPSANEGEERSRCFICPQPLEISRLPTDIVTACYALPAVIHRIESHLVAQEACDLLELDILPALSLEALTKDSDTPDDFSPTDGSVVHFHQGMGNNYERLEFLGDTFLKMATTIAVYVKNPSDSEHEFHLKRMMQLCNNNLYNVAEKMELYEFIRSQPFSRSTWYPQGIKLLKGKGFRRKETPVFHTLGKKTIADVCEALIGAAFLSHNERGQWQPSNWTEAVRAVTRLVDSENEHTMTEWADYERAYKMPKWQMQTAKAQELDLAEQVQREDSYHFQNARLLHSAFTHPSLPQLYEKVPSYQQLEFLGDGLLDMACVTHLFYEYPDKDPQWLTEHKMAMAANSFLGALCVKLGFHRHLRHGTVSLGIQVKDYVVEWEEAREGAGGAPNFWMKLKDPPKALADIVEAYVGALFLDSGFDYGQVMRFFDEHILPFFLDMDVYDLFATNHPLINLERRLNEELGCRSHRVMVEEFPGDGLEGDQAMAGLVIHTTVIGGDYSQSSRYAKNRCALKALEELRELSVEDFRAKFGCDCAKSAGA